MERAGLSERPAVPIEASAGLAMLLLKHYGVLTVHFAGLPPGTSSMLIKFVSPETLTRFAAVAVYLIDAQVGMGAVAETDRGRGAADLLHGDDMFETPHAGASIVRIDGDAEDAEPAQLGPQITREIIVSIGGLGAGRNLLQRETVHRFAQGIRGFSHIEAEGRDG